MNQLLLVFEVTKPCLVMRITIFIQPIIRNLAGFHVTVPYK